MKIILTILAISAALAFTIPKGAENVKRFISQVQRHSDIKELSAGLIREFVDKIYVSEKQVVDDRKVQKIRILWACIGEFTPPTGFRS